MRQLPKNILESALNGGSVRNSREFSMVTFDGEGAICVPSLSWKPAEAWAKSKTPSGNRQRDRAALIARIDVLVTRKGTACASTLGAHVQLAKLRNVMIDGGVAVTDWNFPPADILEAALDTSGKKLEKGEPAKTEEPKPGDTPAAKSA